MAQIFIIYFSKITVNPDIFARVLFSQNFASAKFCGNKTLAKWQISLPFTDVGKSCKLQIFNIANMSFNVIRENKNLAKNSEFTVTKVL